MWLLARISGRLEGLYGQRLVLAPVPVGLGIWAYFALPVEPGRTIWIALVLLAAGLLAGGWRLLHSRFVGVSFAVFALLLLVTGFLAAGLRTQLVRAPVLEFWYYGPVEGRVVGIDRSSSGLVRLTLDRLRLDRMSAAQTPEKIRVSLNGPAGFVEPEPGMRVQLTANLSPPFGPAEPGGYDFRRHAYFDRIGGIGTSRTPLLRMGPQFDGGSGVLVHGWRRAIAERVTEVLPGKSGAFAVAITTGLRSEIPKDTLTALREANLAHLLAISGLHMGLLTGFVFMLATYGLAAIPGLANAYPLRKIAAVLAMQAGAIYLALSGGAVATERAFIMVSVMFVAVILDRRAVTLRAVALAALFLLLTQPESLLEPGFQMSFSATAALVATFSKLRDLPLPPMPGWANWLVSVVLSSFVAGMATAPFAAAHFNMFAHYGLLANVVSVPLMGAIIMPAAVAAALLAPFGLDFLALKLMHYPILWVVGVAEEVTSWPGAVGQIVSPPGAAMAAISLGGVALVAGIGRWRIAGIAAILLGFGLWADHERPDLLVSRSGGMLGLMTPEGRALTRAKGDAFTAEIWLENDGDGADQAQAAARRAFTTQDGVRFAHLGAVQLAHVTGRGAAQKVRDLCETVPLIFTTADLPTRPTGCQIFDKSTLARTGSLAIDATEVGYSVTTAADTAGDRPWSRVLERGPGER
ncbi:MAG: competence protein [Rhodobacterales bacterium]|nr:MAG: competence protein [Rhodobacterales bacterium]PIE06450.1 MAG: competence protein [Rhodobacterales bacterium]